MSLPAIWLMYDLSPIHVRVEAKRRSFLHLLVRFCAVCGGGFAMTGEIPPPLFHVHFHSCSIQSLVLGGMILELPCGAFDLNDSPTTPFAITSVVYLPPLRYICFLAPRQSFLYSGGVVYWWGG